MIGFRVGDEGGWVVGGLIGPTHRCLCLMLGSNAPRPNARCRVHFCMKHEPARLLWRPTVPLIVQLQKIHLVYCSYSAPRTLTGAHRTARRVWHVSM